MEDVNASPEEVRRAEQEILPAFQRDLKELLSQRPDLRPLPADD